jgi:limonene-1,2-epoxide hydrolase
MTMSPTEIAEAFSRHQFATTFTSFAPEIEWRNLGGENYVGKQAVIDACNESSSYLNTVRTTFTHFRTIASASTVVTDAQADYLDGDERSTVASCDLYDFVDGQLTAITSYTVEIGTDPTSSAD